MPTETSVEYEKDVEWVQAGDATWLPRLFLVKRTRKRRRLIPDVVVGVWVEVVDPALAAGVTLYEPLWATPVARSVEVSVIYGEVERRHLRDVPIAELVEDGAAAVSRRSQAAAKPGSIRKRDQRLVQPVPSRPQAPDVSREVRSARASLHTSRIDLGLVANAYMKALDAGRRDPTVAVGERIHRSRSMAAAYVRRSREAGLLPPARPPRRNS